MFLKNNDRIPLAVINIITNIEGIKKILIMNNNFNYSVGTSSIMSF